MGPGTRIANLLLAAALAGCLNPGDVGEELEVPVKLIPIPLFPIEQDHNHSDPVLHVDAANIEIHGYHSGYGTGASTAIPPGEGYSEIFVRDKLLFLGRRAAEDEGKGLFGGFLIFDISQPDQPRKLGEFQGLANYDMESTEDNKFVFYVSQYLNRQQPGSTPPDDRGEIPRGIHIVDIADPKRPAWTNYFPIPTRGAHTLTYHKLDSGRELVVACTYDFLPDPSLGDRGPLPDYGINPLAQRVLLFDFKRTPTPHLEPISTYERHDPDPTLVPDPNIEYNPHDVAIQRHPITQRLLMYVAYTDLGAFILDIEDPAKPTEIAHLKDFSPSKKVAMHLVAPAPDLIAGRHVTIAEPELGSAADETGQYTLFDTTDPAQPVRLGYWVLPGELKNDRDYRFSPHNFMVDHGYLYLAHYHAGVWVVDIHDEERLQSPQALGYIQPNLPRTDYRFDVPSVWGVFYHDGFIFASDQATGLYALRFAADPEPKLLAHRH